MRCQMLASGTHQIRSNGLACGQPFVVSHRGDKRHKQGKWRFVKGLGHEGLIPACASIPVTGDHHCLIGQFFQGIALGLAQAFGLRLQLAAGRKDIAAARGADG